MKSSSNGKITVLASNYAARKRNAEREKPG
jgi:hypothetical protein